MDDLSIVLLISLAGLWATTFRWTRRNLYLRREELKEALLCIDDLQTRVKALEDER